MHFSRMAAVGAVAVTLTLAGCSSPQGSSAPTNPPPTAQVPTSGQPAAQADHNNADVTFAQSMILHHAQAIVMAEMATTRATSPKVRELAANIKQAQQPEIDQMRAWLTAWGAEPPTTGAPGMGGMGGTAGMGGMGGTAGMGGMGGTAGMGGMGGTAAMGGGAMPGMMSPEQMSQMGQASGAQFDRMFLQMMIRHHEGAIEMARAQVNDGQNSEAKQLAQKIIADQQAEITQMQALLQEV